MPTTNKTPTDPRSVAELEAAVVAGDATVTPEMLAVARARADHERLRAEGDAYRRQLEAEAARQVQVEQLREQIIGLHDDRDQLRALAVQAREALGALFSATAARGGQLDELAGRARDLGIVPMALDDQPRDPSGLGWRREHGMAGPARLRVGDTAYSAVDARRLVARVVKEALDGAGQRTDNFTLAHVGPPVEEQIASTVREVTPPELRRLRVAKRWGQHQVGDVVEVDGETAKWALDRSFAVPA